MHGKDLPKCHERRDKIKNLVAFLLPQIGSALASIARPRLKQQSTRMVEIEKENNQSPRERINFSRHEVPSVVHGLTSGLLRGKQPTSSDVTPGKSSLTVAPSVDSDKSLKNSIPRRVHIVDDCVGKPDPFRDLAPGPGSGFLLHGSGSAAPQLD